MRGIERRTDGHGRRASDTVGVIARPHERAVLLAVLLIASIALFLFARDQSRPDREMEGLNRDAMRLEAQIHAQKLGHLADSLDQMVDLAAAGLQRTDIRPIVALEAALAPYGHAADLAVFGAGGEVVARKGGTPVAKEGVSLSDARLNVGKRLPDGRMVGASAPLPAVSPSLAGARVEIRYSSQLPADVFDSPEGVRIMDPAGQPRLTLAHAVPINAGDSGLAVVVDREGRSLFQRWQDDARLLVLPLLIGVVLLGLLTWNSLRQGYVSRQWADTERRFRVAVEAAQCGVWEWDLDRRRIDPSDFMADLLDVPKGQVLSTESMIERIHPRYRDLVVAAMTDARRDGNFGIAFPITLPGGKVRWIDARGQSRGPRRSDGEYTHIMGIALDITEARLAKARAQAAETRLIDGIQSVSDAFVLFDRHGHLLLWNQAFQDAFAVPGHLLRRGTPKNDLNRVASRAIRAEHHADQRRAGVRELELKDGRWLQMTERVTGDGGSVVIAADVTVIRMQEGERRYAAEELQRTVTELEASRSRLSSLAREYEAAMIRAEAASQSKSEFLANMSHELRTPLNAINGFSEIMAGEMFGPLGDTRYKGYAQDIHNSGKHLLSLINDILDMAKIEAGKLRLHYERADLSATGREVVRLMRGRAEEAGLALTLDAPEVLDAEFDLRGIKQVLLNLVSNAIKFTPQAGRVLLSLTPLSERPGYVRVAVTDTGIGIAAEDVGRLAQPFVQVENQHAKTTQGTGLGLALTKSLIEMHGAQMTIDSEPGRGTIVWFDLPMQNLSQPLGHEERTTGNPRISAAA